MRNCIQILHICTLRFASMKAEANRHAMYLQGATLEVQQNGLLGVGGVALLGCLLGVWPGLLGLLSLLGWTVGQAGELAWEYWKVHSEPGVLYLGERHTAYWSVVIRSRACLNTWFSQPPRSHSTATRACMQILLACMQALLMCIFADDLKRRCKVSQDTGM